MPTTARPTIAIRAACGALIALATAYAPALAAPEPAGERVALAHFNKLRIYGPADITLVQSQGESLVVKAPSGRKAPLRIEEEDGQLTLRSIGAGTWWDRMLRRTATPRIALTFEDLRTVELHDTVRLRVDGLRAPSLALRASGHAKMTLLGLATDDLALDASGAVRVDASGQAQRQTIAISGAGVYRAPELRSENTRVDLSGAGRVTVQARDTLTVNVSGAGNVRYLGDPKLTKNVSGAARIEHLETAPKTPART